MTHHIPRDARLHTPPGAQITRVEHMSPAFVKYHLDNGQVLHRFTRPEPWSDPHDHPWSFTTEILDGGYVEEVFHHEPDGGWRSELVHRNLGTVHHVAADHIHRIVELPAGDAWTLVRSGPHERGVRFWRFGDTVMSRAWHEREWTRV